MDVRCDRCATVYDFDESRIPAEGLSVKCSSCAHVFRAWRMSAPGQDDPWMVRQPSGNVMRFKEMTTLQRWIVERKVSRNDEISKSGITWKKLGDIAEFAPFFAAVERPAVPPTPLVVHPPTGARWEGTQQPMPRSQDTGPWAVGQLPDDDDLDDEFRPRGGKGKWVFLALVVLGAGAVGAAYVVKPSLVASLLGDTPDPRARQHLEAGYQDLARDSYASIAKARESFDKAVEVAPHWADAKAALAAADLNRAESLREEAEQMSAKLATLQEGEQAALKVEVDKRQGEAKSRLEAAFTMAKEALQLDPEGIASNRTMADYYRIAGSPDAMRPLLEKAKKLGAGDPWVAYLLGSSVATDSALAERAIRYFDEALEHAPDLQRARYKMARVYEAQGNTQKALLHAETILKDVPDHERAGSLVFALKPPLTPAPAAATPEPPPASAKKPLTADQLVAQAERLRSSDQAERALALYDRASEMAPDDPDVHTGLGWCHVDLEEPDDAIRSFKDALKLAPRFTDAHLGLAEAYRMKGMKRDAVKHYQVYLDILPEGPEAQVAARMIKQLAQ